MEKIDIRGLKFDNVDRDEARSLASAALMSDKTTTVFTPNAEIAYNAGKDETFFEILSSADILLPDGAGIIKASKILGTPLKEKVAGVDFGIDAAALCAERGKSLFLLGGKPGVADAAAENLRTRFPNLKIAGTNDGYFSKSGDENDAVISKINESGADALFVCIGSPAQEKWAVENKAALCGVRLVCCLGGSIDVYAGVSKRAPKLFIKTNTEWLYRLLKEPKRIGRMMSLPKYIIGIKKYKRSIGK